MPQPRSMSAALAGWGDLTGEKEKNVQHDARERQKDLEEEERGFSRQPFATQGRTAMPGVRIPIFGPNEQMAIAQGNLNRAMDDHRRENDSRVSQNREMRRMAHEQELARINAQASMANANADREAMLIRELLSGM